jgi:hypothetical protein
MEAEWMGPPGEVASQSIARGFGQKVAEKPIIDDMRGDAGLGKPGVARLFVDTSTNDSDDTLIVDMSLWESLPRTQLTRMLDYRHHRNEFASLTEDWKRPDAVCGTRQAKEYYEIKPMSDPGIIAANYKFEQFDKFLKKFELRYRRGTSYMTESERREKEIDFSLVAKSSINNLLSMFKLRSIRLFVVWERPMPAMILYFIKIKIDTRDSRPARGKAVLRNLARFVLSLAIQDATGANLVSLPKGVTEVKLPEELSDYTKALSESAGGWVFDAVPGETHLWVIEEAGYQRIIERQRQLPWWLRSAGPMFNSEEWTRFLREAEQADELKRHQIFETLLIGAAAGMALYLCWPIIAAGAEVAFVRLAPWVARTRMLWTRGARPMANTIEELLSGEAANDNAVKVATKIVEITVKSAAALIPVGYILGSTKDAKAAESIQKTGIATLNDEAFDPTWMLRPTATSGPGPSDFGSLVDVAAFGLATIATPDAPALPAKMRLIGRITFT